MGEQKENEYREKLRQAARHLRCAPNAPAVVRKCRKLADERCDVLDPTFTPAERLQVLADHSSVHFEVARTNKELDDLVEGYARKGEFGFLTRRQRFDSELLAAILRRQQPVDGQRRFVALVDARGQKQAMAFFSQAHEVAHPILEPQLDFEFRDETKKRDEWESLVDRVGAEMVFSGEPWCTAVDRIFAPSTGVTIEAVETLRDELVAEASLTAVAISASLRVNRPMLVLWAGDLASQRDPAPVLRVLDATPNALAVEAGTFIHRKRRVPATSPIAKCRLGLSMSAGFEDLSDWVDSNGTALPRRVVWTAARRNGNNVQALMDFGRGGRW